MSKLTISPYRELPAMVEQNKKLGFWAKFKSKFRSWWRSAKPNTYGYRDGYNQKNIDISVRNWDGHSIEQYLLGYYTGLGARENRTKILATLEEKIKQQNNE